MGNTLRAERLLSLFTSADRAAAIAGDLTEQREHRGPIAFWLDVVGIMASLWRRAVTDAPLRVSLLAVLGSVLLIGPALIGLAAVGLFPGVIGSPVSWVTLAFFWWGGALWAGAELVVRAPNRGMAACATLAVAGEAVLIALVVRALLLGLLTVYSAPFYTTSLVVPAPLLIGAAMARRRMMVRGITRLE